MNNDNDRKIFDLKLRIIERAEAAGLSPYGRATAVLDLDNAHRQFDLRLEDWLAADDINFAHDWVGIQQHMNRSAKRVEDLFLPRFATSKETKTAQMEFIALEITKLANRFIRNPIEITYRRETEESVKDYTDWGRKRFGIHSGFEYFYVWRGEMLYAVDVTADSPLTAADELMRLLAAKF